MFFLCSFVAYPVLADEAVQARGEVNVRLGDERSITMTEIWAPIAQDNEAVLYGDVRVMGDDADNREGNIGVGYRKIVDDPVLGNGIAGVHGWVDRRLSARGNTFYQATAGVEWLGDDIDLRGNVYVPLSGGEEYATPNVGASAPYMAGTGIYVDTVGQVVEEAQTGVDIEAGTNVSMLDDYTDSARIYAGVYAFDGANTDKVAGFRTRLAVDVTENVQVGARFQNDHERGPQGFVEATLRFPFDQKKSYRKEGLRARLDESPERDIDIVTAEGVDTGIGKPVLNAATGVEQEVIHVNNTAAAGGDGSAEHPYNTLAAAESAASEYSIIYVHRGTGGPTGQNNGIILNKTGQQLIGSGTDFIWDAGKFQIGNSRQSRPDALVIKSAGSAPMITNAAGLTGITLAADKTVVAGVTVDGAGLYGIHALNDTGETWESVEIRDVEVRNSSYTGVRIEVPSAGSRINNVTADGIRTTGNASHPDSDGIWVKADYGGEIGNASVRDVYATGNLWGVYMSARGDGGRIETAFLEDIQADGNNRTGVQIDSRDQGIIENLSLQNVRASSNIDQGVRVYTRTNGQIGNLSLQDITTTGNTSYGTEVYAETNALIDSVSLQDITSTGNAANGVYVFARTGGQIAQTSLQDVTSTNNIGYGVYVNATNAGSVLNNLTASNITANTNTLSGVLVSSSSSGSMTNLDINNITTTGNTQYGTYFSSSGTGSVLSNLTADDITTTGNGLHGTYVVASAAGSLSNASLSNITTSGNTQHGIQVYANGVGSSLNNLTLDGLTTSGNTQHGMYVLSSTSGSLSNLTLNDITASTNTLSGLYILASVGTITGVDLDNITATGNTQQGVHLYGNGVGGSLSNVTANTITTTGNTQRGLYIQGASSGVVNNMTIQDVTATGNAASGFHVHGATTSNMTGVTLQDIIATGNSQYGGYVQATGNSNVTSVILNAITATGNTLNGVFVDDDTTGTYNVDMGGGVLGGTGGSSIHSNTGTDLRVDLDGGALKAENNWWGDPAGLQPARRTLDAASTVDSTPFLGAAP